MHGEYWQCSLYRLAFTTWHFSFYCLSLHIFKFSQSIRPEMGERNFPFYQVASPNLSWLMNSLQNFHPFCLMCFVHVIQMFFCKNMPGYKFPETRLSSGRSNGPWNSSSVGYKLIFVLPNTTVCIFSWFFSSLDMQDLPAGQHCLLEVQ